MARIPPAHSGSPLTHFTRQALLFCLIWIVTIAIQLNFSDGTYPDKLPKHPVLPECHQPVLIRCLRLKEFCWRFRILGLGLPPLQLWPETGFAIHPVPFSAHSCSACFCQLSTVIKTFLRILIPVLLNLFPGFPVLTHLWLHRPAWVGACPRHKVLLTELTLNPLVSPAKVGIFHFALCWGNRNRNFWLRYRSVMASQTEWSRQHHVNSIAKTIAPIKRDLSTSKETGSERKFIFFNMRFKRQNASSQRWLTYKNQN